MTLDPQRLVRALSLTVDKIERGAYVVTGGSEPHAVRPVGSGWECDCVDSRYHAGVCKHRLAAYLHRRLDRRVLEALRVAVSS